MRVPFYALILVASLWAGTASAGSLNFADGRGTWQSTQCQQPQPPAGLSGDPEAAANNLNAQWVEHNQYAEAAQAYMNCLSAEAQRDANAASATISQTAQSAIQQMQASVESLAARLRSRQSVLRNYP